MMQLQNHRSSNRIKVNIIQIGSYEMNTDLP